MMDRRNEEVRRKVGNMPPSSTIWRKKVLKFIGRTTRQRNNFLLHRAMTLWVDGSRIRDYLHRTNKDAIVESICILV